MFTREHDFVVYGYILITTMKLFAKDKNQAKQATESYK